MSNSNLLEKYEFRSIKQEEAEQAVRIEQICFPPNEACSPRCMKERITRVPELFLVVVDKEKGSLAGFLNGIATDDNRFRDDFFLDAGLHKDDGKNVMLLGLDVLPEYRGQGIARKLLEEYAKRERANHREKLILTCLEEKVKMYQKFGLTDHGMSDSNWGEEEWHEMSFQL